MDSSISFFVVLVSVCLGVQPSRARYSREARQEQVLLRSEASVPNGSTQLVREDTGTGQVSAVVDSHGHLQLHPRSGVGTTPSQDRFSGHIHTGGDAKAGDTRNATAADAGYQRGQRWWLTASEMLRSGRSLGWPWTVGGQRPVGPKAKAPVSFAALELEPAPHWHGPAPQVQQARQQHDRREPGANWWLATFFVSLVCMGLLVKLVSDSHSVEQAFSPVEDVWIPERGRPCYIYCCAVAVVMLSLVTFLIAFLVTTAVNVTIENEPLPVGSPTKGEVFYPIPDRGQRAFEAGIGVAASLAVGAIIVVGWRYSSQVHISDALLVQFVVRGATVALLIAGCLEFLGAFVLDRTIPQLHQSESKGSEHKRFHRLLVIPIFSVAGFSEEFGKIVAVLLCTWFDAAPMRDAEPGCCAPHCRMLLESPLSLMLAGLSVGVGFMSVENMEYLIALVCTPSTAKIGASAEEKAADEVGMSFVRIIIMCVRIGLNIHPWLVGITCARAARLAFEPSRSHSTSGLSFQELMWSLWPSAALHAAFDSLIVILPSSFAIFLPGVFWYGCRYTYYREWSKFADSESAADAAGDPPPQEAYGAQLPGAATSASETAHGASSGLTLDGTTSGSTLVDEPPVMAPAA